MSTHTLNNKSQHCFLKILKLQRVWEGAMETPHHGNASKTAFEEFPFYFGKSLKTGKG